MNQPKTNGAAAARPLHTIAADILKTWRNKDGASTINYAAKPYLDAMQELDGIDGMYYADTAKSVVLYFLANANTWRGNDARRIKKELRTMAGLK